MITLGPKTYPWAAKPSADIGVADHGSIVLLHPQSQAAREFLTDCGGDEAQWFGLALVVEHRYANDILSAAVDTYGLSIEPRLTR